MEFSSDVAQFYPNRITVTSPRERKPNAIIERMVAKWFYSWGKKLADEFGLDYVPPSKKEKIDFLEWKCKYQNIYKPNSKNSVNLSENSKRNIRDSIFAMYQHSKPRTIKAVNGKFIYNFRQSFITLTLPAKQIHSDVEIKKALNHFLTNIRRAFNIQNYVWKAELQKNENIHFHISIDKYIHFQAIRYYWLLALKPLGYVDAYAKKWSGLTISEYAHKRGLSVAEAVKPYSQGVRSNWQSPNCVDVSAVTTISSASNYLSKYFAKSSDENLDPERVSNFGKVWARSQSLSRLKYVHKFEFPEIRNFLSKIVKLGFAKKVVYDYAIVYYLNFKKLAGYFKKLFFKIIKQNANRYNYPFPVP